MKTEIHLVLDASGSMWGLRDDTIGSLNKFVKEQKEVKGKCRMSIVQFNSNVFTVVDNEKLKNVPKFNGYNYSPTGTTALYDAIGQTATAIEASGTEAKVILVIMTDGMENASMEWKHEAVKKVLDEHPEWEVVFLGANIDSASVASSIGVAACKTMDYAANPQGVNSAYASMSENIRGVRSGTKADMTIEDKDREAQKEAE